MFFYFSSYFTLKASSVRFVKLQPVSLPHLFSVLIATHIVVLTPEIHIDMDTDSTFEALKL